MRQCIQKKRKQNLIDKKPKEEEIAHPSQTDEITVTALDLSPRTCKICGDRISSGSKSGYCLKCSTRWRRKKRPPPKVLERRQKMLDHIRRGTPFYKMVHELSWEYHVTKYKIAKEYIELFSLAP